MSRRNKAEYELLVKPGEINFAPRTLVEEILQNVLTICTTMKHSVPMDRAFGVDGEVLDEPVIEARAQIAGELIKAVRKFEPRAKIIGVSYDTEGEKVYPRIKVKLVD